MTWDKVLTINNYYDGPRLGVAMVSGVPHIYESEFDHSADEYGDTYFVAPIEGALLAAVLEDWEIWLRWNNAHRLGEVEMNSHPALPSDRPRHAELQQVIAGRLRVDSTTHRRLRAEFRNLEARGDWTGTEVRWSDALSKG